jgi:glycosyltransferase involved in cell wall biosynthesis
MNNRPLVAQTVHGFLIQREQHGNLAIAVRWGERQLSRFTDLSFFVSLEDLEEAQSSKHRGLLRHLGNGVSDDWFTGDLRRRKRSGRLRAVFVGRVCRGKGILDLLEAIKVADQVELVVIGDQLPSERDGAMAEAVALAEGLEDRVQFTGMIEAPAIRKYFAEADLFVLPSLREGLPLSIIEAMASGLPVLATSIRGCRELVTSGLNGWLVPPGNPGELASALQQAEHASDDAMRALGLNSFERAGNYRELKITARILEAYAELGVVV